MDDPRCQRKVSYWRQVRLLATLDHEMRDELVVVAHVCAHKKEA